MTFDDDGRVEQIDLDKGQTQDPEGNDPYGLPFPAGGGGGELLKATHRLTAAEIRAIDLTPVVLVPGEPGVMFVPAFVVGASTFADDDVSHSGGDDMPVAWTDGEGGFSGGNAPIKLSGDLPGSLGMVYVSYPGDNSTNVYLNSHADAVGMGLAVGGTYGSPFTGDGTIEVDVALWYTRWELA